MLDKGVLTFEFEEKRRKVVCCCRIDEYGIRFSSAESNGCELF